MIVLHFLLSVVYVILFTSMIIAFYFYISKFFVWLFYFVKSIPSLLLLLISFEFSKLKHRIKTIPTFNLTLKSSFIKKAFLFLLVFNTVVYMQQLIEWNGKRSAYPKAKCYYAAGNVVALYRSFLAPVLSPNNILTFWFELPQRIIYSSAEHLIPKDDGELALWRYHWFVYPFSKRFTMPYGLYESDWNPLFRDKGEIATIVWKFIQAVDKDNFKDKNMRDKHALRNLPLAVLYIDEMYNHEKVPPTIFVTKEVESEIAKKPIIYTSWQKMKISYSDPADKKRAMYYKKSFNNLWLVNQKSYYIATTAYETLTKLESKWQESEFMSKEVNKHKSLEATRIAAMIAMLQGGALDFKFEKEDISCRDSYVVNYLRLRKEIFSIDSSSSLIRNLANRYTSHISAEYFKYLFDNYCDYNLTGAYDTRFGTGPSRYEQRPSIIKKREILLKNKIIKED